MKFDATVEWVMAVRLKVEAESEDEAREQLSVESGLPKNGEYIPGSFRVTFIEPEG